MNVHENARLTPQGRVLLVHHIGIEGWRVGEAAAPRYGIEGAIHA